MWTRTGESALLRFHLAETTRQVLDYGISLSGFGNSGISQSEHGNCTGITWEMILSDMPVDNTSNASNGSRSMCLGQPGSAGIADAEASMLI